ncbi:GAF domain-containing protein [Streptomyces winkii]|uniref:GAF domain-containing protein n=1 Tax=Streptomyces winkii TaxID=3051178 RepID=UPI0028D4464E|nr:GAF and ANTAR domain-containing protein [Streptomyces sp. DSM 40971]
MNREQQVSRAFVALSDTFAAEFDPLSLFQNLVRQCVGLLDVTAAGVMLDDGRGQLRIMAISGEEAGVLEMLQLQTDAGPCMDCYRTGSPLTVADLSEEAGRWPGLVPHALEYGYRSLHTVPLQLQGRVLGAVNLFRTDPGTLDVADQQLAQAFADISAVALMHWSVEPARPEDVLTRMQSVISAKVSLEVAKGMVAQAADISVSEAGELLRDHAAERRMRLSDLVHGLTDGSLSLREVTSGEPEPHI